MCVSKRVIPRLRKTSAGQALSGWTKHRIGYEVKASNRPPSLPVIRTMNNLSVSYIKRSGIALFLVSVVFMSGCTPAFQSFYVQVGDNAFEPTEIKSIELYATKLPTREYQELGLISLYVNWNSESNLRSLREMKKMAAERGANAILNLTLHDTRLSGVAVRWK
jgi:hypothetical protein